MVKFIFSFFILISATILFADETVKIRRPKMDREAMYYFLTNVFGPQSQPVIKKNILLRANLWGGPCDPYAQVYKLKNNKSSIEIEETECPDEGASAKLEFYIEGDVLALALLDKTCVELVENKETLNFFLNRYKIKNLNDENLMKAYSVFFPIKKASSDWISKAKNKNDWVQIVLSMCRSPLWQLL